MPQADQAPNTAPNTAPMTPLDIVLYVGSVVIWGLAWIATHYQVGPVAPEVSIVWRYAIATPMMFAFAMLRGERLRYRLTDHIYFLGLGLCLFSVNYLLFYYASAHVASGLLSIVFTLAAVINVVMAAVVFGMKIERRAVIGGVIGMAGVAAMFYPEMQGITLGGGALLGLTLGFIATVLFCIGNMISISAQRRRLPVFAGMAWAMLYGTLVIALMAVLKGAAFTIDTRPVYLWALAYLSVIGSFVGFGMYFTLLNRIGAARAGYSTVLYPVIALVASTFFEGYRWTPLAVCGLIAVLVGVGLVLRKPA